MALRRKITKTAFEALHDELKKEYKVSPKNDAEYHLDVDDASELTRAVDRERKRAEDAEANATTAAETIKTLEAKIKEGAGKTPDIEALERSWAHKLEKAEKKAENTVAKLQRAFTDTMVDGNAKSLASEISTSPSLMARAIKDRLSVEFEGDTPHLRVLGTDGKPTAATLDELKQELLANKEYSAIVIASKASGGSATAPKGTPFSRPGSAMADQQQPAALSTLKPKELSASLTAAVEARRAQQGK
jgi:translation initiation factor 2B subunit (eIF-2B alpha/beta/delta family)